MITIENIMPSKYNNKKIHCGVTASISCYKMYEYIRFLQNNGMAVSASLSARAHEFLSIRTLEALSVFPLYSDSSKNEPPFAHLYPVQAVDVFVIAPATANIIGKIASGIADSLLSTQAISYNKALLFAPAMNTHMWENPIVQKNIAILREYAHCFCPPQYGKLACKEEGIGKLAEPWELYLYTLKMMTPQLLTGKKIVFTVGGTKEPWDSVRYCSNYSSGLMGYCLALTAWMYGATVYLIATEDLPFIPRDIFLYTTPTAEQLYQQCSFLWESMDIGFFVAAVADFIPIPYEGKYKKEGSEGMSIECILSKDIVYEMGKRKTDKQTIVAFCAETDNLLENMKEKIQKKNADIIVGNYIEEGVNTIDNVVQVLDREGNSFSTEKMSKMDLAFFLIEQICLKKI
ncbi:MAG: bifunctional phosphopantothenoylcysteine decarboxylase/phosphopantothenate--cysteine ligase CoaBC [Desulfovibrionaceae bacterium]